MKKKNMHTNKIIRLLSLATLIFSLALPIWSFAQGTGQQSLTQVLTANNYSFTTPDDITFDPTFVQAGQTKKVQKVLDPTNPNEIIKFTDLRGSNGGGFAINAYTTKLVDDSTGTTINHDKIGIATRTQSGNSCDTSDDNLIDINSETTSAPLLYNGNLNDDGTIPSEDIYTFNSATSTYSNSVTLLDGSTLPNGFTGRTGDFSIAPVFEINIPADTYGTFHGTITFELILS